MYLTSRLACSTASGIKQSLLNFISLAFLCLVSSSPLQIANGTGSHTELHLNSEAYLDYLDSVDAAARNTTSLWPVENITLADWLAGNNTSPNLPVGNITSSAWSENQVSYVWSGATTTSAATASVSAWRNVSIIVDLDPRLPRLSPDGLRVLGGHMGLWLAGTSSDGPLQIEYVRSDELAIRVYDWSVANANQTVAPDDPWGCDRRIFPLGQTNATNLDMASKQTGQGLVASVYQAQPGYRSGTRTGLHFVRNLSNQLGLGQGPVFNQLFGLLEQYEKLPPLLNQSTLPLVFETVGSWGDSSKSSWVRLDLLSNQTLPASTNATVTALSPTTYYPDSSEPQGQLAQLRQPLSDPWNGRNNAASQAPLNRRANQELPDPESFASAQRATVKTSLFPLSRRVASRQVTISSKALGTFRGNTAVHTWIEVEGVSGGYAPLRVEVLGEIFPDPEQYIIRVREILPVASPLNPNVRSMPAGVTSMSNAEIKKAAEAFLGNGRPKIYRAGVNGCNAFASHMLEELRLQPPNDYLDRKASSNAYYADENNSEEMRYIMKDSIRWDGSAAYWERVETDMSDPNRPAMFGEPYALKDIPEELVDRFLNQGGRPPLNPQGGSSSPQEEGLRSARLSGLSACGVGSGLRRRSCEPLEVEERRAVALARLEGKSLAVRLGQAAGLFGAAVGVAVSVAFVVIDFINGDYVGAAIGLTDTALSIAAAVFLDIPMGFLVSAFLAFVSGLLSLTRQQHSDPKLPDVSDAQQIIQYCMFGDAQHTGNEQCRAGTADHPGNPNCTVMYGPGIIASVFGWSNFDAVIFMLKYNNGHAMPIPEIAAAFKVIAPGTAEQLGPALASSLDTRSDEEIATIHYDTNYLYYPQQFSFDPTFQLNRNLITIPVIGQTADVVFNRLIPNPGGDCKIIEDPGTYQYAQYNLSVSGAPVAIACNVTSTGTTDGTSNLVANMTAQGALSTARTGPGTGSVDGTGTVSVNGTWASGPPVMANSSTDGQDHRTVPPPQPPLGLPTTLNSSNAVCMSGPSSGQCFPTGTFQTQQGSLGFNSSDATNLSMPTGSWISYNAIGHDNGMDQPQTISLMNITSATDNATFHASIYQQAADATDHTFDVHVAGPDMPVLCLFTLPNFLGDVACYGPGSGNVPANMINRAQSIVPHGAVQYWIYAGAYGDAGGLQYSSSIPDLTQVAYGAESFNLNIKALWIIDPMHPNGGGR